MENNKEVGYEFPKYAPKINKNVLTPKQLATAVKSIQDFNGTKLILNLLVRELIKVLEEYQCSAVAAIQLGHPVNVFVIKNAAKEYVTIVNPVIKATGNPGQKVKEGSITYPGLTVATIRFDSVQIKYLNENLQPVTKTFKENDGILVQMMYECIRGKDIFFRTNFTENRSAKKRWAKIAKILKIDQ